jgi:hypothetical protein
MYTERQNFHRISYFIFLIGLLSVGLTGQRVWLAGLRSLTESATTVATISQPLVIDAGTPALLLLNAEALALPLNEGSTQVTARVRDAEGKAVAGVVVQFNSTLGSMDPANATTDAAGVATATFNAGGAQGQAVISAAANGLTREAAVEIRKPNSDATANTLALDFAATKLDPGQQVAFSAILRDGAGEPVAGELVSLFGSLGEVTPASVMSDANGRVSATYRAGAASGQAMITALAGYTSKSATFQVGEIKTDPQLTHKSFLPLVSR